MMNGMKNGMMNIKLRGYTSYGYLADINNRILEFATETELKEWIGEYKYGTEYNNGVCILGSDRRNSNANTTA